MIINPDNVHCLIIKFYYLITKKIDFYDLIVYNYEN